MVAEVYGGREEGRCGGCLRLRRWGLEEEGARGVLCVYGECAMLGVCSIFLYI